MGNSPGKKKRYLIQSRAMDWYADELSLILWKSTWIFCIWMPQSFGWRSDPMHILLMEEILHHLGYINLVNNGINYISTGAGFLPSTVAPCIFFASGVRWCHHGRAESAGNEGSKCLGQFNVASGTDELFRTQPVSAIELERSEFWKERGQKFWRLPYWLKNEPDSGWTCMKHGWILIFFACWIHRVNSFLNVPATDLRPVMVRDGDEC